MPLLEENTLPEEKNDKLVHAQLKKYAEDVARLYGELKKENQRLKAINRELAESFYATVLMGFDLITLYDEYLGGHCKRVAYYSDALAAEVGLSQDARTTVKLAGLLHDVGLLGIPRQARLNILLGEEQSREMVDLYRNHPIVSVRPIVSSRRFKGISEIIAAHHENLDGSGFPRRLVAKQIPQESGIIHIADAYDILRTHTRTRPEPRFAVAKMQRAAGTKYDADLLMAFRAIVLERDPFASTIEIGPEDLQPGMILAEALVAVNGVKLLSKDTVLREDHIQIITRFAEFSKLRLPIKAYRPGKEAEVPLAAAE